MEKIIAKHGGERIDKFLAQKLDKSRSLVQKLIKDELVLVNGEVVKTNYSVADGDEIDVKQLDVVDNTNIIPQSMDLDIVYEDDDLLVINKPSGLVVHPAPGHYQDTLVNGLLAYSNKLSDINGEFRPGIVHRIDKDTSGLLVVCKNNESHEKLANQLSDKTLFRQYLAIVHGEIEEDEGEIIAPIGRDPRDRVKMAVVAKNSKEAQTNFKVLERYDHYTLVSCNLLTGRTHQIRVHFDFINYPLVGDPLYGIKPTIDTKGQALHAYKLGFIHPRSGEYMEFEAKPPQEFVDTLNQIKG